MKIDASAVEPGTILLDKYRVERVLGQGGMGIVVAARHVQLGELFAIKFLLPVALRHTDAVRRFVREARASARLKSEHVAKVHDVGHLPDGRPYMILEHLDGSDLKAILRERGRLPAVEAVDYVIQAGEALAEAHELGIVHRDLKPANMFLTRRRNGSACVKVLDFGVARQLELDESEQHALTKTGAMLGTPYYMSPEQMRTSKEADPRSDLWSLGCVLYELLTGQPPFNAAGLTELVSAVLSDEPTPPRTLVPAIPLAVDAVVMRCLKKDRSQRFQSASDLIDALRAHADPPTLPAANAITTEWPPATRALPITNPPATALPSPVSLHGETNTSALPSLPAHPPPVPPPLAPALAPARARVAVPEAPPLAAPHVAAVQRFDSDLLALTTGAAWGHTAVRPGPSMRPAVIAGTLAGLALAAAGVVLAFGPWATPATNPAPAAAASARVVALPPDVTDELPPVADPSEAPSPEAETAPSLEASPPPEAPSASERSRPLQAPPTVPVEPRRTNPRSERTVAAPAQATAPPPAPTKHKTMY